MNLINENVKHSVFGQGIITEFSDNKIHVQFDEEVGFKTFIYPDAFEKFLKAMDPVFEKNVMEECHKKNEQNRLELEHIQKEREIVEQEERDKRLELSKKKPSLRAKKKST